jgi:hypothetical protein
VDADGLTLACATVAELKAGRKAGLPATLIGLRGASGLPEGRLVSFGLAGALRDGLPCGTVLDAVRVVDPAGETLWSGPGLGVSGARAATILAADEIVDGAAGRRALHERTGADAADLESGPLARAGRLAGCLRVVSDTPARPLNGIEGAVSVDGRLNIVGLVGAFLRRPAGFVRAASDGRRALSALGHAAEGLAA